MSHCISSLYANGVRVVLYMGHTQFVLLPKLQFPCLGIMICIKGQFCWLTHYFFAITGHCVHCANYKSCKHVHNIWNALHLVLNWLTLKFVWISMWHFWNSLSMSRGSYFSQTLLLMLQATSLQRASRKSFLKGFVGLKCPHLWPKDNLSLLVWCLTIVAWCLIFFVSDL